MKQILLRLEDGRGLPGDIDMLYEIAGNIQGVLVVQVTLPRPRFTHHRQVPQESRQDSPPRHVNYSI